MDDDVNCSLLILGNGFDLNCKLESSFSDFYKTVSINDNIWYILFHFAFFEKEEDYNRFIRYIPENDILWMDVEDFIKRVLFMHHKEDVDNKPFLMRNYYSDTYCGILKIAFEQRLNRAYFYDYHQFSEIRDYFARRFPGDNCTFSVDDFLRDELVRFENDFKAYIKNISNRDLYNELSRAILQDLKDDEEAIDIITFNYTYPNNDAISFFAYGNINHIHGDVNNDIIIGFDSGDIVLSDDDMKKVHLSKAFQKLFFKQGNNKLPSKNQVLVVKFYGHSLGEQDYSYFHAIFDYYDLYDNGNISWEFYYTPYKDTDTENDLIRERFVTRVYSLLNNYSVKNNRGEKVNSLISRLFLENRLLIKIIDKTSDLIKKHNITVD